jgi:hypothetical protein
MLEISLIIIQWIFFAYTSYRIGNKLHIKKSYPWYIIPLWNFWILAKKSEIKIKDFSLILIMILILFFFIMVYICSITIRLGADLSTSLFLLNRFAGDMFYTFIGLSILVTKISVIAIFWGSLARKIGKEYGVYVVLGLFSIYLPPLLLTFESIDKLITTNKLSNMYSPLVGEEKEVWDKENGTPKEKINRVVSVGVLVLIFSSIVYTVS